jgi:hypothetical protein
MARVACLLFVIVALLAAGCNSAPPAPELDEVLALPMTGLPQLVPQSLGGEYRALPESWAAGRGVMLLLHGVPNPADVVVFVDGTAIPAGVTTGTLPPGQIGRFSVAPITGGADVAVLLPLAAGLPRKRTTIAIGNTTGSGRVTAVVDTPSAAAAVRPEPSDVYFCNNHDEDWFGQPVSYPCLAPRRVVAHDVLVAGWLLSHKPTFQSNGTLAQPYPIAADRNCATYCEDIHYYLLLDPSFLARTYNQPGIDTPLTGAHLPGSDPDPAPLPVQDSIGGGVSAVTINSFALPGTATCNFHSEITGSFGPLLCIKGEQPTWHIVDTPPVVTLNSCFCRHAKGLGTPPAGWRTQPTDPTIDPLTAYPYGPVGGIDLLTRTDASTPLRFGDYVIAKATLWQDFPHGPPGCFPHAAWDSGWLEIHSIDWIVKAPPPARPATAAQFAVCANRMLAPGQPSHVSFATDFSPPPSWFIPHGTGDTVHFCTLVDERFTTPSQVSSLQIQQTAPDTIHAAATLDTSLAAASLTDSIVMWWAAPNDATLDPACHGTASS